MEIHYRSRHCADHYPWYYLIQRYYLDYLGPDIFGVPSSIGVSEWNDETGKHFSIFFNVFVLLQVFNEINARKLKSDEINVF